MRENQRVILSDALETCDNFAETYRIKDRNLRESEQKDFLERISDDIKTVLRLEKS